MKLSFIDIILYKFEWWKQKKKIEIMLLKGELHELISLNK